MIASLLKEMEQEGKTTRRMLERVPDDKYDWKPHAKSMNIRSLATHIADLPSWVNLALDTNGLDFATSPYDPKKINTTAELLDYFDETLAASKERLAKAQESDLEPDWTLRNGEHVLSVSSKGEVVRMAYSQVVHHRAQLGVYLRLLDVPVPGSYGPSADEMGL